MKKKLWKTAAVPAEARYLWQTDVGDVIIVRNAGPVSKNVKYHPS